MSPRKNTSPPSAKPRSKANTYPARDGPGTARSREHNTIAINLSAALVTALRGRDCEAFGSDMRVFVPENLTYAYPDMSVVCGEQHYIDAEVDTMTSPIVLIEIQSPSAARYDRAVKFIKYRRLPSLVEYVLVHQDAPHIERFEKACDIWTDGEHRGLESTLELTSIGVTIKLADIYDRVTFPPGVKNNSALSPN